METEVSRLKNTECGSPIIKIAITGPPGSGKSVAGHFLEQLGLPIIDTDKLSRQAVEPGSACLERLQVFFGPGILNADQTLNRQMLMSAILKDHSLRRQAEAILHPEIFRLMKHEIDWVSSQGHKIVIAEVPLLFEAGWQEFFDVTIAIYATHLKCYEHLVKKRGVSAKLANAMLAAQLSGEEKAMLADFVVNNTGTMADFTKELERLADFIIGSSIMYRKEQILCL